MKLKNTTRAGGNANRLAFTLMEVMVAVSIIAMVFVTIFSGLSMGLSVTSLSRENLRATQIMLDKMEGVRLYSWTQLNDSNFLKGAFTNMFFETNNIGQATAQGNGVAYTGTVAVADCPFNNSYSANMRQVTVTIGWTSGNVARSRTMSTYVSMMGLQNYVFDN